MQQAKKLVILDEFDREYKRLQRPVDAVAKTGRSLQLSDTLRESSLDDDRKVKEYVAALHRYLNVRKELPPQPSVKLPPPLPPPRRGVRRLRGIPTPLRPSHHLANDVRRSGSHPTDMDAIYDDVRSPGSFGGIRNLMRYSGRSEREVKTFLFVGDAYTLYKPRRIRFPRRKTYSMGIADLYQIDQADVSNISSYNDGVRYLLTCINVFSKKAWAVPVRTKTGREVANAFEQVIARRHTQHGSER